MTIDEAIRIAKAECKDHYAQSYLNAMPEAVEEFGSEGFISQLVYAQANMQSWRGPVARECKKVIRTYLKHKGRM